MNARQSAIRFLMILSVFQAGPRIVTGDEPGQAAIRRPVVVGTKPFAEGYLLAEIFAQQLEAVGLKVTRKFGLGGTEIIFPALQTGAIDLYPEYTGTGALVILQQPVPRGSAAVFELVSREFATRYGIRWLPPLGFENTYAMAVRTEMAERLGLRTISDFARVSDQMRAGFTADFIGLPDGLPMLRDVYGFRLKEVNPLAPAIKYQALAEKSVDIIDGYSTDGMLSQLPLTVLEDDRGAFPPYDAAALVRGELFQTHPEAIAALTALSGRIDESRMRRWNQRVEVDGVDASIVAAGALRELGLGSATAAGEDGDNTSLPRAGGGLTDYLWRQRTVIGQRMLRHLLLVCMSLTLAVLVAVPVALGLQRAKWAEAVLGATGVLQTIPGIALLAFMLPVLGIGIAPAVVALFLYSLYPVMRNTYTGLREADRLAVEAANALGMTARQTLIHVQLPLAMPIIMAGIRTAAVLNVGTATLAAFIGAGGLGDPIVSGLALGDSRMILSGAIPAAVLAVAVDRLLAWVTRWLTPQALRA